MVSVEVGWQEGANPSEGVQASCVDECDNSGGTAVTQVEDVTWANMPNIEPYSNEKILSLVEIAPAPGKGRCMFSKNGYEPGELILIERPLFVIVPDSNPDLWKTLNTLNEQQTLQLSPLWHQAALVTILTGTKEKLDIMQNKWVLDRDPPVSDDVYRILDATCVTQADGSYMYSNQVVIDPKLYQFLLQVWPLNAFGHSTDPNGLVIYDKISYLAHSCDATACWHHYGEDLFILRSRRRLNPGDELTISYLGEPDLLAPTFKRRELLQNWSFLCACPRCIETVDTSRGFLCKLCHYGRVNFYEDQSSRQMASMPCTLCEYRYNALDIKEYLDLERAYVERIEGIDSTDLWDIQQVYNNARNVFNQHWCLYQLQTLLFECYKERGDTELARFYMQQRIFFADSVMRRPLYCVAFMYEEFADMLVTSAALDMEKAELDDVEVDVDLLSTTMDSYFRAAALLAVLSGYNHPYYYSVVVIALYSGIYVVQCKRHRVETIRAMEWLDSIKRALSCLFKWRKNRKELLAEFKECCQLVAIKRAGGELKDDDFWNLYGYFKQTVVGDFNVTDTSEATDVDLRKWASWKRHRGMSKREAMAAYVATVRQLYGYNDDVEDVAMSNVHSRPKVIACESTVERDEDNLFSLVIDNQVGLVEELLKAEPSMVNLRSPEGLTALHLAADRGHVEVVKTLLRYGADINAVDDNNDTPLLAAAAAGNRKVVDLLLRGGADGTLRYLDRKLYDLTKYRNIDNQCYGDMMQSDRK
ncbi:Acyl-CoA-binding domain-containing protein 6 [Babesia sp. Xinjiang]|uniref:Acyl-CoA-binding domain-containing protein 6 n=1 Tax=Babesia sp. Xinjiang TaxID=462227 RepID=UPI000A266411|nr:Acyl-CoA-binding domain-containing protein 6 [Babesia sp. Xinjiang]ORM39484.1 Acyl-CoA-binding domain-containing protein 6 [Babesia sp. Xinjiang]